MTRFTKFKGYAPFIVIIKYWVYSLYCTIYPCSLFIFLSSLYFLIPYHCERHLFIFFGFHTHII